MFRKRKGVAQRDVISGHGGGGLMYGLNDFSFQYSGGNTFQYMWWVPSSKKCGLVWANQDEKEISLLVKGMKC